MRLATLHDGPPDGRLVVIAPNGESCAPAPVATLPEALERWDAVASWLDAVDVFPEPLDTAQLLSPLPRAWQWLDGSAYKSHGELTDRVIGMVPVKSDLPLMYQGVSNKFYPPIADVKFPDETLGIDFEGEFGVMVDAVPMGVTPEQALRHIKLAVQINDWSLRTLAGPEMKTGFGWVQAKPPCGMAPFAATPDELGEEWREGRDNKDETDGREREAGLALNMGSVICIVDMLPGKESPMHRTNSIDYGIVIEGEIELELDDGATKTVRQGGIIIQRGTIHLWRNRTDKPCRIVFVLIEAPSYMHDGKPLPPVEP